jgi:hypothetical protein
MGRPALSLIPGGLSTVPNAPATPTDNAARSALRIVAAAQRWATMMIESGQAEGLTLDGPELDQVALALLDSVDEYEAHSAGLIPREQQRGPATGLW